jgi:hypothetical protein
VTRGWGYNVYKISNSLDGVYSFQLKGDSQGSAGAAAEFRGRVVVRNGKSVKPYAVNMSKGTVGRKKVKVRASDPEVYLIVAATPCCFRGNQTYSYQVKIDKE